MKMERKHIMKRINCELKNIILELYQDKNNTVAEIADVAQVSTATVWSIVKSSNVPLRKERNKAAKKDVEPITQSTPVKKEVNIEKQNSKENVSVAVNDKMINALRMYDIVWVDMGEDKTVALCGRHPAIIIQSNKQNFYSDNVVVMFGTTKIKKSYLPTNFVLSRETFGLTKNTMFMANQLCTINKSKIISYIGSIDDKKIKDKILDAYLANMTGVRGNLDMLTKK